MKKLSIILGVIMLLLNIVLGMMFTCYDTFNCVLNCAVIIVETVLLYLVSQITLKDGFRVSLYYLVPLFSFVEFICGLFSSEQFSDNWFLITILLIFVLQIIILTISNYLSKNN